MLNKYSEQVTLFINYLLIIYMFLLPFNTHLSNTLFNIVIILFFFSGELKEKFLYALKHKVVQSLFIFYAMYFLWSFQSQHMNDVIWKLKEFKYLFGIIIVLSVLRDDFKEKILNAFIFAILISIFISFAMKFHINIPNLKITGYGQLTPFFYTYSQYVLLVIITSNILLYRIIQNKFNTSLNKFINYFFFILTTLLVFLLDSKLGYILYLIASSFIVFKALPKISKAKLFLVLMIFFTTGYTLAFQFSPTFHSRSSNLYNQTIDVFAKNKYSGSTGVRFAWDAIGLKIALKKPFFGYGTHEHIDLVVSNIKDSNISNSTKKSLLIFQNSTTPWMQTLHNEYLDHLVQFGIIGLFILLNIFYSIYKEPSSHPQLQTLRYLLLIVFMLYMFVNYFFVLSQLGKIFFLLISLTLVTYQDNLANKKGSIYAD